MAYVSGRKCVCVCVCVCSCEYLAMIARFGVEVVALCAYTSCVGVKL